MYCVNKIMVSIVVLLAAQSMAQATEQNCTPQERQQFYEEVLVAGRGTNAEALTYLHGKLIADGYKGQVMVLQKNCGEIKLKTDDIQFFELTYRLEKSRNSHPLAFAQVVNFQLLGSYQVNDDGSYKYLTIRVLTSAESLEAPNGGHGSSSTAN